jgi:polyhydroxyalkanoate synthase subunit PhaC
MAIPTRWDALFDALVAEVALSAGLHRDFIKLALDNAWTRPGGATVLDTPVDLGDVDVDIVAGANDHIVPWENAYRSTQLLGGESRFVLSTSGHIQALVNPPGSERRSFRVAGENPPEAEQWLAAAEQQPGSWWPDYLAWLQQRSGALKPAPKTLGSRAHKATGKAPGTYVLAR